MTSEPIRFSDGAGYDRFMGVWSRLAGQDFLDWIGPSQGQRWLDVGCGNGAFTQLIAEQCEPLRLVAALGSSTVSSHSPAQLAWQTSCSSNAPSGNTRTPSQLGSRPTGSSWGWQSEETIAPSITPCRTRAAQSAALWKQGGTCSTPGTPSNAGRLQVELFCQLPVAAAHRALVHRQGLGGADLAAADLHQVEHLQVEHHPGRSIDLAPPPPRRHNGTRELEGHGSKQLEVG